MGINVGDHCRYRNVTESDEAKKVDVSDEADFLRAFYKELETLSEGTEYRLRTPIVLDKPTLRVLIPSRMHRFMVWVVECHWLEVSMKIAAFIAVIMSIVAVISVLVIGVTAPYTDVPKDIILGIGLGTFMPIVAITIVLVAGLWFIIGKVFEYVSGWWSERYEYLSSYFYERFGDEPMLTYYIVTVGIMCSTRKSYGNFAYKLPDGEEKTVFFESV